MILNPDNKIKLVTLLPFYCCSLYQRGKVSAQCSSAPVEIKPLLQNAGLWFELGTGLGLSFRDNYGN